MRRMFLLGILLPVGALSIVAAGRQAAPAKALSAEALAATQIEKVRDNLYMITGSNPIRREAFSGGNTAVFVTSSGVVLVDTKLAGWGQTILDRVRTVTDKPITTIINTHTHGDHTGSNPFFGPTVDIVSHENAKANMLKMDAFKGENAAFAAKRTFKDTLTLGSGPSRIDLHYFGRGHTDGDTWVVFPALRVMHTGDIFAWKDAPFLDRSSGGSGLDYPQTIGRALATATNVDTLIVGHSPLRTIPELREHQQFMTEFVTTTKEARKAGKSVDDATTAVLGLAAKYKDYRTDRFKAAVEAIYDELK